MRWSAGVMRAETEYITSVNGTTKLQVGENYPRSVLTSIYKQGWETGGDTGKCRHHHSDKSTTWIVEVNREYTSLHLCKYENSDKGVMYPILKVRHDQRLLVTHFQGKQFLKLCICDPSIICCKVLVVMTVLNNIMS